MDFVAPILTPVVNSLLVPVKRALSFLISSSKYVREMQKKEQVLDGAARDMHNQQEANNANSRMVPHRVRGWLKEVEDIKAEITEKIPTGGVGCCNMKMKYKAGKDSSDIAEHIDRLMEEKAEMVWSDELIPLGMVSPPRPPTSATVHEDVQSQNKSTIESRDLIFKDVLKSLEPNNSMIQKMALCGMGGIGKTTLMKQLKKAAKDRKMFQSIVYLEVGQNPNIISIQQVVAEQLGEPLTETVVYTRADRLQKRFELLSGEGKNKILIILDDVWEKFDLEDIGLTSCLPNGSKLLITSRKEDVCTDMCGGVSSVFEIKGLKDPEDKKLFWESAGLVTDDIEPNLLHIGEDIVKRCGGLPLALVTIGSNLRNKKEKSEWNDALLCLKNNNLLDDLNNIFMFSYENLKKDDLKAIFLLCGLLSEEHNILIDDLLVYGWGLRFFKHMHTIAQARNRVETCVNTLIRSNLLIKSELEGGVKMHDLVRDFVLSSFSEVKQASIVFHGKSVSEQIQEEKSYGRILLNCEGMSEFPVDFNHPNLTFLKVMDGEEQLKFPEDFFSSMKKLEVFACESMHQVLLPQSLASLRVLFLDCCSLVDDDIYFIGDLINLEVLGLVDCDIERLPSKIGNLKRLRLLDLSRNDNLSIDDGVLEKLEKLEELYIAVYEEGASKFTDANCKELKMLLKTLSALKLEFFENKAQPIDVSFENLERFRISVGCSLGCSDKSPFLNTLKLNISSSEFSKCKFNELFVNTEILHLEVNDMSYLEDILVLPPQSPFPNLKELCISECASLKHLFTVPVAKCLKKLESLKIISCSVLRSVVSGENSEAGVITFPLLKVLHLKDLPELVSLCDLVNAIELPQLMELGLNGLPSINSFFPGENTSNFARKSFLKREDMLPNLKKLTIRGMENLKEIWPCESASDDEEFSKNFMFREIQVRNCNSLENLFPSNPMQLLNHLEELRVVYCGSIEVLFHIDLVKTEHLNSNSSLRVIKVEKCKSFREVCRIKFVENYSFDLLIRGFQAVESICITDCVRFRSIVTPTTLNFDMSALSDIDISNYKSLALFETRPELEVLFSDSLYLINLIFLVNLMHLYSSVFIFLVSSIILH